MAELSVCNGQNTKKKFNSQHKTTTTANRKRTSHRAAAAVAIERMTKKTHTKYKAIAI